MLSSDNGKLPLPLSDKMRPPINNNLAFGMTENELLALLNRQLNQQGDPYTLQTQTNREIWERGARFLNSIHLPNLVAFLVEQANNAESELHSRISQRFIELSQTTTGDYGLKQHEDVLAVYNQSGMPVFAVSGLSFAQKQLMFFARRIKADPSAIGYFVDDGWTPEHAAEFMAKSLYLDDHQLSLAREEDTLVNEEMYRLFAPLLLQVSGR